MLTTTLALLQTAVQLRADVVGSVSTYGLTEITDYINRGIARVHGLLAKSGEPYYRTLANFMLVGTQQNYYTTAAVGVPAGTAVLPTDIFMVEALDIQLQNNLWSNCDRMNWEERNDYQQNSTFSPLVQAKFQFMGSGAQASIYITPPPQGGLPARVWYWPVPVVLVSAGDTWDTANRWDEYVIAFAARLIAERDENYQLSMRLDQTIAQMDETIKVEGENRIKGAAIKIRRRRYKRNNFPWGSPGGIP